MPSWRVHRTILSQALREVSGELRALGEKFEEGLYRGVVEPDEVPDGVVKARMGRRRTYFYIGHAKHHTVDETLINYYYNLALYYARRGRVLLSGVALGRAIHYAQDGSVKTRRFLILDEHERVEKEIEEALKSFEEGAWKYRRGAESSKKASTQGLEALCIAYEKTSRILKSFLAELTKPVDVEELRKRVQMIRGVKAGIAIASILVTLAAGNFLALAIAMLMSIVIALYRPKTYYEAMRAGLMVLKPYGFEPAY